MRRRSITRINNSLRYTSRNGLTNRVSKRCPREHNFGRKEKQYINVSNADAVVCCDIDREGDENDITLF